MMRFLRSLCAAAFGFDPADPPDVRRHDRAVRRFIDDGAARGATADDLDREYRLRVALAELRRRASDWTLREPHTAARAITAVAEDVGRKLPKDDAKVFAETVGRLTMRDLLLPEAFDLAEDASRAEASLLRRRAPTRDELAALR